MAILQSCCFWKSVRKGSYASAVYTLIYFGFSTIILLIYVNDEQEYLTGDRELPAGESILERGDVTPTTVIFNILFLICSLLLIISSMLVIIALQYDQRSLMLPWIVLMLGDVTIELAHLIYLALMERVIFDPVVGFLFTIDFFIMCLNCYCLLCVISQYQDYRHGRGCRRITVPTPQIVLHISQTEETATPPTSNMHHQLNQLAMSPFISTNSPTNISTIPEEAEKNSLSSADENGRSCTIKNGAENLDLDTCNRLKVPAINSNVHMTSL